MKDVTSKNSKTPDLRNLSASTLLSQDLHCVGITKNSLTNFYSNFFLLITKEVVHFARLLYLFSLLNHLNY